MAGSRGDEVEVRLYRERGRAGLLRRAMPPAVIARTRPTRPAPSSAPALTEQPPMVSEPDPLPSPPPVPPPAPVVPVPDPVGEPPPLGAVPPEPVDAELDAELVPPEPLLLEL